MSGHDEPQFNPMIGRESAARMGEVTRIICDVGVYISRAGWFVMVGEKTNRAKAGTVSYPPDAQVASSAERLFETVVEVKNESTLTGARALRDAGCNVVVLNMASGTVPGGGYLSGSRAQEEYLARSSALVPCLEGNPMYAWHAERGDPLFSNWAIYSPDVPVFRDDTGAMIDEPWPVSVITCAAPVTSKLPTRRREIEPAMRERIARVMSIGLAHGHDAIVLGAWGCGAYGGDPHEVAPLFREALAGEFRGAYRRVRFSIADTTEERVFIGPFEQVLCRNW